MQPSAGQASSRLPAPRWLQRGAHLEPLLVLGWLHRAAGKGAANQPWQGSALHGGDGSIPLPGLGRGAACSGDTVLGGKGSAPLLTLM